MSQKKMVLKKRVRKSKKKTSYKEFTQNMKQFNQPLRSVDFTFVKLAKPKRHFISNV